MEKKDEEASPSSVAINTEEVSDPELDELLDCKCLASIELSF